MIEERRLNYANKRRRGLLSSNTKRVIWKSRSRHIV